MILRAFLVWLVIAAAEVLQSILRVRFPNRRVGDRRARQIDMFILFAVPLLVAALRGLI